MSDMASKYRAAAARRRALGDTPGADWCDEQADWHMRNRDEDGRVVPELLQLALRVKAQRDA